MIREHATVALTADVTAEGLAAGDIGAVVGIYQDGKAYEVEFTTIGGRTVAVVTLFAAQVR